MPTENNSPNVRSVSEHARENSDFLPIIVDNNSVRCCGPQVIALNEVFGAGLVVGRENLLLYAWLRRPIHYPPITLGSMELHFGFLHAKYSEARQQVRLGEVECSVRTRGSGQRNKISPRRG